MGAFLGIGLAYGRDQAEDTDAKAITNDKAKLLYQRFHDSNASVFCRDILEAGKQAGHEENLHDTVCTDAVSSAVRLFMSLYEAGEGA